MRKDAARMIEAATTNGGPSATHWEGDRIVFSGTRVVLGELEADRGASRCRPRPWPIACSSRTGPRSATTSRLGVAVWHAAKVIQVSDTETDFHGMPKMAIRYSHPAKDLATN
jgi:hypothetical protein